MWFFVVKDTTGAVKRFKCKTVSGYFTDEYDHEMAQVVSVGRVDGFSLKAVQLQMGNRDPLLYNNKSFFIGLVHLPRCRCT